MHEDPLPVHKPMRAPAWTIVAIVAAALWCFAICAAYIAAQGDAPRELFVVTLTAAGVVSMMAVYVGMAHSQRARDAEEHEALFAQVMEQHNTLIKIRDTILELRKGQAQQRDEQRRLWAALAENTAGLRQINARLDDIANPDRTEWVSYAQAASDLLGLTGADVIPLTPHRKGS